MFSKNLRPGSRPSIGENRFHGSFFFSCFILKSFNAISPRIPSFAGHFLVSCFKPRHPGFNSTAKCCEREDAFHRTKAMFFERGVDRSLLSKCALISTGHESCLVGWIWLGTGFDWKAALFLEGNNFYGRVVGSWLLHMICNHIRIFHYAGFTCASLWHELPGPIAGHHPCGFKCP